MKTDNPGGDAANEPDDNLEERLSGHFTVALNRAGRDYPALRERLATTTPAASRRGRGRWPRIAFPLTSAAVLAVATLVASGLLSGSSTGPATQVSGPGASGVVMSADGIPTQIDGQRVYRVAAQSDWETLSGSFLLGAYAVDAPIPCAPPVPSTQPQSSPEAELIPQCGVVALVPLATDNSEYFFGLAPRGLGVLTGWLNGPGVVMRVHTHDPRAAGCSADQKSACEAALVLEAVVWPVVPIEIVGERVYRAADQATFPTSGSFLLGGVVTEPDVIPPCPAPDESGAELALVPYCSWIAVDSLHLAPKGLAMGDLRNEPVVVRVHVSDSLAAQCPAAVRAQCSDAIVVEAVVWHGEPLPGPTEVMGPTPTPGVPGSPNSAATAQLGPDGVPTKFNGEPVYRAANLSTSLTFLLGGKLTQDTSCAPPTAPLPKPPACGFWTLDGVKVGTMVDLPESLLGQTIIARVERGRSLSICLTGSCFATNLVVDAVVWPAGDTVSPPPPPSPTPMAS